ncbi:alpha/beta hydrolase [Streptomyces sp. B1866]|uniref:alpha/beta hydrolase n=1 Tax=Streptomyces sp. B1866 TaxID=3075431 RepID=UPI00289027D5|nr:alpha/beta hydrolase [Streptomyces sp. B1866]MDT3396968.1 alpha/beta hydrolase [Streptomyces sp. B1866]
MPGHIRAKQTGRRARALVATALVAALATLAGCSGGGSGDSGTGDRSVGGSPGASAPARPAASPANAPAAPALPASLTGQRLAWHRCPPPSRAQGGGDAPGSAWQCATLRAPLDYDKPDGETIGLALIRSRAREQDSRIGSLLFNFGGPGGSGVQALPGFAQEYERLHSRYDLVSFDPRGVGESAGVRCYSDEQIDASDELDATPDNPVEVRALTSAIQDYNAACLRNSGKVLGHVDTVSAARDMDLMRQVLGDSKLYYFGVSYGTELGGVYAHLYPTHVGRAVLDAVVDPTQDSLAGSYGQAKGFQLALDNYLKDCARHGSRCPTGGDAVQGRAKIVDLLRGLEDRPLPTEDGRELTAGRAMNGIAAALYGKDRWSYLSLGLYEALEGGSGDTLLSLADSMSDRDEDGHYSNSDAANSAINCLDYKQRYTERDVRAQLDRFRAASPVFGEWLAWGMLGCTGWPVPGKSDHPEVGATGSAPIVVVGNTGDPATPYAGMHRMAEELGPGVGIELTYQGDGHSSYLTGDACVTEAVNTYLLDGRPPASGTRCGGGGSASSAS